MVNTPGGTDSWGSAHPAGWSASQDVNTGNDRVRVKPILRGALPARNFRE
jgi:hypothetical protein